MTELHMEISDSGNKTRSWSGTGDHRASLGVGIAEPLQRYRPISRSNIESIPQWKLLDPELQEAIRIVSLVLPFRSNEYVINKLIDWSRVPADPIFKLTFPQREMLQEEDYLEMLQLVRWGAGKDLLRAAIQRIRRNMNPHPGGQLEQNVPRLNGQVLPGMQHKYAESVLFFPANGQTCHAYCTFCFRWPQFVGDDALKIASREVNSLVSYLQANPKVTDVIFTGGDPLVMRADVLRRYIEPLLSVETLKTIRIGTKSLVFWPHRFVDDGDADDLLRLFEGIVASGKHLAIMAHISHPVELSTGTVQEAVQRIRNTGAILRTQSPIIRHINDRSAVWGDLWSLSARLGMVPYYMFVERDTGPHHYYGLPLVRCWEIFRMAYQSVSGIARTVRGPVMSSHPGKCHILGVTETCAGRAFVLEFLQARNADLVRRPFFARFDPTAMWFDELEPLTEADCTFLQPSPDCLPHCGRVPHEIPVQRIQPGDLETQRYHP